MCPVWWTRLWLCVLFCLWTVASTAAQDKPKGKKIVLIAGPLDGHPKHTHEYEKSVILLKHCLQTSSSGRGAKVEAHFNGWPTDSKALDNAGTIVLISGGSDRDEKLHPLYVGERFAALGRQMKRGCGLVLIHWSTFHPRRVHDQITEWVGGYFDYETGPPPRNWYSKIETRQWTASPASPEHPLCRGVKPFRLQEEFYFRLRFRDGDSRLTPILFNQPRGEIHNDLQRNTNTVAWAVERKDGGRGFGFTGGHFFRNWWIGDFRKLVLNAIIWSAHGDVPAGGVESDLGEPIKLLLVTGHNHPAHDWRKVSDALQTVLEHDPRVVLEATIDPEKTLAVGDLEQYNALVLNYCNWNRPGLGQRAKERLIAYLRGGGGLSVVHFANGAFNHTLPNTDPKNDWEEYRTKIVRRAWIHGEDGSGHDPYGPFQVDITKLQHPITAGLAPFETVDELYFKQQGPLPIEPLATGRSRVTGDDEPLAWAYRYGQARVFQTVLGHAAPSIRAAGTLIRRGTVWSAGAESLSFDPPLQLNGRPPAWSKDLAKGESAP